MHGSLGHPSRTEGIAVRPGQARKGGLGHGRRDAVGDDGARRRREEDLGAAEPGTGNARAGRQRLISLDFFPHRRRSTISMTVESKDEHLGTSSRRWRALSEVDQRSAGSFAFVPRQRFRCRPARPTSTPPDYRCSAPVEGVIEVKRSQVVGDGRGFSTPDSIDLRTTKRIYRDAGGGGGGTVIWRER